MESYAQVPKSIIFDKRISSTACRVFAARAILAWEYHRTPSFSEIAIHLGYSRRQVIRAIAEIKSFEPAVSKRGAKPVKAAVRRSDLIKCGTCGQRCRQILKVGWCRGCNWRLKVQNEARKVLQEELSRAAVS